MKIENYARRIEELPADKTLTPEQIAGILSRFHQKVNEIVSKSQTGKEAVRIYKRDMVRHAVRTIGKTI